MFISRNNNFAGASRYFVHFYAVVAPLRRETFNFTSPLYGVVEHYTKIVLSFSKLTNDRYGPKEKCAKICQIKWNWIRSVLQLGSLFSCFPALLDHVMSFFVVVRSYSMYHIAAIHSKQRRFNAWQRTYILVSTDWFVLSK